MKKTAKNFVMVARAMMTLTSCELWDKSCELWNDFCELPWYWEVGWIYLIGGTILGTFGFFYDFFQEDEQKAKASSNYQTSGNNQTSGNYGTTGNYGAVTTDNSASLSNVSTWLKEAGNSNNSGNRNNRTTERKHRQQEYEERKKLREERQGKYERKKSRYKEALENYWEELIIICCDFEYKWGNEWEKGSRQLTLKRSKAREVLRNGRDGIKASTDISDYEKVRNVRWTVSHNYYKQRPTIDAF